MVLGSAAHAQAPAWQTVITSGQVRTYPAEVTATATDAQGNVYLTGTFTGDVQFGTLLLTSAGNGDVFVAKWNPTRNRFMWARRAGGTDYDYPEAVAISGSNVYVTGLFTRTARFGNTTLTTANSSNNYHSDVFVMKLIDADSTASFGWAVRAGGAENDRALTLAADGANVYLGGGFYSPTATFGAITLTNADNSTFTPDAFVAKLTDAGSTASFDWAQRAGGTGNDQVNALAVSGANVYAAGFFGAPRATFGTTTLTNYDTRTLANTYDVFVSKLTNAGSFVWTQQAGGPNSDNATALAVRGTNVYVAGDFVSATASFGAINLTNSGPTTFSTNDVFVAKLTDNGAASAVAWAKAMGGTGVDMAEALAVSNNSVVVAGYFQSTTARFGNTTLLNANTNTSTLTNDVFVAKLTDAGSTSSIDWAQQAGGNGADQATALAVVGSTVYVGGTITPPASFGSQTFLEPDATATAFLAPIALSAPLATATAAELSQLVLFPNPARTHALVRIPAVAGATTAVLTLTDALGRAVRTQRTPLPATGTDFALRLEGLAPGLYVLRVEAGARQTTRRLALE